ncbi:MAG: alkaline phosphatase family protein [Planctomycetota bacterium]
MRLPRWTAYVALALIATLIATAVPRRTKPTDPGAGRAARATGAVTLPNAKYPRIVVLGVDGMDPEILTEVMERYPREMTNFRRLVAAGDGVRVLGTSTPPQSPVAWSNFITGRNPGGHGVFDFIHRNPQYGLEPSTVVSESGGEIEVPFTDYKIPTGGSSGSNRSGRAFWSILADAGVPADLYRVPINYPVEPSKGVSFPGMLTPALDSAYGAYTIFTTDPPARMETSGGKFIAVRASMGAIRTELPGPENALKEGKPVATTPLTVYVDERHNTATIEVGDERVIMRPGQISRWCRVSFEMLPMGAMNLGGIVRFHLKSLTPEFELYASPINFDPRAPVDAISAPADASEKLAEAIGDYYTQGMAEEVSALKDGAFTDAEFMAQAQMVYLERERMLDHALDQFTAKEEGGLLFFYVSSVDLAMHMMWRHTDPEHPFFDPAVADEDSSWWSGREGTTWRDVVDDLYLKIDPFLGEVLDRVGEDAIVMVMSDHGFAPYRRKFSLNTWLIEEGYLVLKDGAEREKPEDDPAHVKVSIAEAIDWSKSKAYGIGFNSLYLNLRGRESEGIVDPGAEAAALLVELKEKLEAIRDEERGGEQVVLAADLASVVYAGGERLDEAPDIVVGYNSGYGNSDEATQGRIPHAVLTDNLGGTFNGSHLMHPSVVNGVLLTNRPVSLRDPRLEDLTVTILHAYGVDPTPEMVGRPILATN